MNPPVEFLTRLARAITSFSLYRAGHPARESALDEATETLTTLLASDPEPVFTFLEDDVIYQDRPLSELRNLPLSRHLTRRRIQRIEISTGLTREEFRSFLEETSNQLSRSTDTLVADPTRFPHIRFGSLEQGDEGKDQDLPFDLKGEVEKVDFLHEEVAIKGRVSTALARAVVQTLSTAMRYGSCADSLHRHALRPEFDGAAGVIEGCGSVQHGAFDEHLDAGNGGGGILPPAQTADPCHR